MVYNRFESAKSVHSSSKLSRNIIQKLFFIIVLLYIFSFFFFQTLTAKQENILIGNKLKFSFFWNEFFDALTVIQRKSDL